MKLKKLAGSVLATAMLISTLAIPVSAAEVYWGLGSSYTKTPFSYAKMVYDVGSVMPYDDVSAGTHTKLQGSSGYSKVSLTGANGGTASSSDYSADSSGWMITDWATVGGTDTAQVVNHWGNTGSNSFDYYVY